MANTFVGTTSLSAHGRSHSPSGLPFSPSLDATHMMPQATTNSQLGLADAHLPLLRERVVVRISGWWTYRAWNMMMTVVRGEHKTSTRALGMLSTAWHTIPSIGNTWCPSLHQHMLCLKHWLNMNKALVYVKHCACNPEWPGLPALCMSSPTSDHSGPFSPLSAPHRPTLCCSLPISTWWWLASLCKTDYNSFMWLGPIFPPRRQIPWRQNPFLPFRFNTLLSWELHKPYCFGHVGCPDK